MIEDTFTLMMLGLMIYFAILFCLHGFLLLTVSFLTRHLILTPCTFIYRKKILSTSFHFIRFYIIIDLIHINLFLLIGKVYYPGGRRRNFFLSAIMFSVNWYYYFAYTYISLLRRRRNCGNPSE